MSRAPKRLTAALLADLEPALQGWALPLAYGVGWDGSLYAVARRSDEALTEERGIGVFPKSRLSAATDYLVLRWMQGRIQTVVHRGETIVISFVQPFPGGVLLAGGRCHWRPECAERNAVAIDWSGNELGRFTLGDGIQDVRVTRDGTIWVSYFDEGIFGNYGWGHPGPPPIGSAGLVAFSSAGEVQFAYDAAAARTDSICDAYAMNVADRDDVWVYFYTEFPIVRIREGKYRSWKLGVSGARALAVHGDRALLLGDYKRPSFGRLVELGNTGDATVVDEVLVEGPAGVPLHSAEVVGVGERLVLFHDREVMVVEGW